MVESTPRGNSATGSMYDERGGGGIFSNDLLTVTNHSDGYNYATDTTTFPGHPFTDVPAWVDQSIDWTWQHQLMTGITATTFKPNDPITRAQVARLDERLGLSPWAWQNPTTAPGTLPFRPDAP